MGLLPHRGPLQSEWLRICRMQLRARLIAKDLARHCQDNTLLACRLRATKVLSIFITPRTDGGRSSRSTAGSQCTMGIPSTIVSHAGQDHRQSIVPAQNVLEMQLLADKNGRPSGSLRLWEDSRRRAKCRRMADGEKSREAGDCRGRYRGCRDMVTACREQKKNRQPHSSKRSKRNSNFDLLTHYFTSLHVLLFCCYTFPLANSGLVSSLHFVL